MYEACRFEQNFRVQNYMNSSSMCEDMWNWLGYENILILGTVFAALPSEYVLLTMTSLLLCIDSGSCRRSFLQHLKRPHMSWHEEGHSLCLP